MATLINVVIILSMIGACGAIAAGICAAEGLLSKYHIDDSGSTALAILVGLLLFAPLTGTVLICGLLVRFVNIIRRIISANLAERRAEAKRLADEIARSKPVTEGHYRKHHELLAHDPMWTVEYSNKPVKAKEMGLK
jgi:hypothetical protein